MNNKIAKTLFWVITCVVSVLYSMSIYYFITVAIHDKDMPTFMGVYLILILLFILVFTVGIIVYVYRDAPKRGLNPWFWMTLAAYLPNFIGVILYLVMRNNGKKSCKACKKAINKEFVVCPFCGVVQEKECSQCGKGIESNWKVCPYCGKAHDK